ncbi:hypothetical protein Nepgr_011081 [Nepenthes gracilis]|uniref:Uncharacterized protein n=1 Tax=Nepenthes gracilis TaxID=150966 RepID=A0AAD3XLY8_NEPGR|nr:hypothetical protein Nepgr_011081 [Nepenthes gracilis]
MASKGDCVRILIKCHLEDTDSYMDIKIPIKEVPSELTRELLIAISQSVPDTKLPDLKATHENFNGLHGAVEMSEDRDEELRSELISISNVRSPDTIALPGMGSPKGQPAL